MSYQIDGATVPLVNMRTNVRPLSPPKRIDRAPGAAERVEISGPALPPDMQVTGLLRYDDPTHDEAVSLLHDAMTQYAALDGDGLEHEVLIYARLYSNCTLARFGVLGEIEAYDPGNGNYGVMVQCVWHWTRMTATVQTSAPV